MSNSLRGEDSYRYNAEERAEEDMLEDAKARIPTNRGNLTVNEIMDEVRYGSYSANRGYGLSAEKLARFFGDVPAAAMEARYQREHRLGEAAE